MFQRCQRQWRFIPTMGPPIWYGLDAAAVVAVISISKSKDKLDLFDRVQWIERGFIAAQAKIPLEELLWPKPIPPAS